MWLLCAGTTKLKMVFTMIDHVLYRKDKGVRPFTLTPVVNQYGIVV
jgi:hypothetical protein